MNPLKKLLGETAIYGVSSIIGRFLNYLLVPLYTNVFLPEQYGVVTEFYAYVGFLIVLLTYGMETTFFRFTNTHKNNPKVFSTAALSVLVSSLLFMLLGGLFSSDIATALRYPDNSEYVLWFALILGFDAISAIPFAKLRAQQRPIRFGAIKLIEIGVNIGLNLFFLLLCKGAYEQGMDNLWAGLYNPAIGVGYIFIINLVASAVKLVLLSPEFKAIAAGFDRQLFKKMLHYTWPLVLVGMAGVVNEMLDRALLKYLLPYDEATNLALLGIYGANYKLAMLMSLFVQAFRYAGEPFFFANADKENARKLYADVLKYFVIFGCVLFLAVMFYLDIVKHFIGDQYHSGLKVVPILLFANLFLGMVVNLSIWYKLTNKTRLGAVVSIAGALVTIVLNVLLIPKIGYMASAWATLATYFTMTALSLWYGNKYYPVKYDLKRIAMYMLLALGLYLGGRTIITSLGIDGSVWEYILNTLLLLIFLGLAYRLEKQNILAYRGNN